MDLDNITDIEWFRKELKKYCAKVIKDIPNTIFKAGNYYPIEQDEGGVWLHDWDGKNYCDLIALSYEYADEFLEKT